MREERREIVRPGTPASPRILVVEDEADLSLLLAYNLEAEGYLAECVERGDEAELRLAENPPDLLILDWMLPGVSGLEICRRLRARESYRTLPVIMLTARGEEGERVRGLSVGADDYVVKPFQFEEVLARLQALLRRAGGWSSPELKCGAIVLDTRAQTVRVGGMAVELTTFEYRILEHLMLRAGEVVSKSELTERLYDQDFERDSNVIEVLVGRLRRKLDPAEQLHPIETLRGRGYRFALPRDADG